MQQNAVRPGVFEWVSQIATQGANIVIAGEEGSGKTYLMEHLIKDVLTKTDSGKSFLSLKRFPVLNIPNAPAVATAPARHNDSPLKALSMQQDRLFLDEAKDGETLENIFLFHDLSSSEGRRGQYVFTLESDTTVEEKIKSFAANMSGDEVCSEFIETIDFVIYMIPEASRKDGYPGSAIDSIKEVIVDADGNAGERTIWKYDHLDEEVYLLMGSPSRRRREKFFWC